MYPAIERLWRYPVKSMLGEACDHLDLNSRGIAGDRFYAVRDRSGKLGSGKSTRRFQQIDGLLKFRATLDGKTPIIHFPDGQTMRGNDPNIHSTLSDILGQPVTLARETNIEHLDAGPVHIVSTAALAWLQAALPAAAIDERRFRPNLVIDVPGAEQVESGWLGKIFSIGDNVRLRAIATTERCAMVTFAQEDLPHDSQILRQITEQSSLQFGVYAEVLVPGPIYVGDKVLVSGIE